MTRHILASAVVLVVTLGAVQPAAAVQTSYTITGTGSGSLDGIAFSDTAFRFVLTGDTDDYVDFGVLAILAPLDTARFAIAGRGTGRFLLGTRIGINNRAVFFARTAGNDIFDFNLAAPVDLDTEFSVTAVGNAFGLGGGFQNVPTSRGALTFTSAGGIAFRNNFGAGTIPEPGSWALLVTGFGLVGSALRQRRQRVAA